MTSHTLAWKKEQLAELEQLIKQYPIVLVADIEGFPASLFQQIRKKLSKEAVIKVTKTRVLLKALENAGEKKKLNEFVSGSCAVIFTNKNPFELFSYLKKNKGSTFEKEGMVAENDIIVPAGDTGLPPGPALSDLKAAGLPVKMQGPTIQISEDKVVTKKGAAVDKKVANVLAKLDIKPIKIGLNIKAAYEEGIIYLKDTLDIDTEQIAAQVSLASSASFQLALEIGYLTPQTTELLLGKAFHSAKAVALEGAILTPFTTEEIIAKASRAAASIKEKVPETVEGKPPEEKTEEKNEEKKEESSEEKKEAEKPSEEKEEVKKEEKEEAKTEGEKEVQKEEKVEEKKEEAKKPEEK